MVFFANLRRSKTDPHNEYTARGIQAGVPYYPAPRSVLRRTEKPINLQQRPQHNSSDSLPSPPSDFSLPPVYTDLDIDTSRYPKPVPSRQPNQSRSHVPPPQMPGIQRARKVSNLEPVHPYNHQYPTETLPQLPVMTPILAAGSVTLIWDVRESPMHMRQPRQSRQANDLTTPATSTMSERLCLISHDFPWSIDVSAKQNRPLTALDIVEAIYESLDREIRRSEWALAPDGQKYALQKANRIRRQADTAKRLRRVDWLGSRFMFRGLERDDNLARKRLMPGDRSDIQTWVIRFGSR